MTFRQLVSRVSIVIVSTVLLIAALETVMQMYHLWKGRAAPPESQSQPSLYVKLDTPVLYGLNPRHPGINSLGMRDDEVAVPKPGGLYRILLLGDSVSYGIGVARGRIYPDVLERLLAGRSPDVEVVNAGVGGYSTYNELQYYLVEGRKLEPDLVIVQFCMNDVVNPRIHWGFETSENITIPMEAIPSVGHDTAYALPLLRQRQGAWQRLLSWSRLFNSVRWRWKLAAYRFTRPETPAFITAHDTISIRVLMDRESEEMRWFRSKLAELNDAVAEDGLRLMVVIFPLAYQLDPDYPYLPQKTLTAICRELGVPCLDLLPALSDHRKEDIFLMENAGYRDVWHLSGRGHEVTASLIFGWLDGQIDPH